MFARLSWGPSVHQSQRVRLSAVPLFIDEVTGRAAELQAAAQTQPHGWTRDKGRREGDYRQTP